MSPEETFYNVTMVTVTTLDGPVVEFACCVEIVGSIPGQVIPTFLKWHLVHPCLALRIKRLDQGKWSVYLLMTVKCVKCDFLACG